MSEPKWRRILLKLSGEAFAGEHEFGFDTNTIRTISLEIKLLLSEGVEVAIVVGGGNFFRGAELEREGVDRARADNIGMVGTIINALALQVFLEQIDVETRVQSAIGMMQVAEPYIPRKAIRDLEKGRVVIFGAGLGAPFFSTDTTSIHRALEVGAEAVLMAKNGVDGVYDSDPRTNPDAKKYDRITHDEVIAKQLGVADATAMTMARENKLPIFVFNFSDAGSIIRIVNGELVGTLIE